MSEDPIVFSESHVDVRHGLEVPEGYTFVSYSSRWPSPIPVAERLPEELGFYLAFGDHPLWMGPTWQVASLCRLVERDETVWVAPDSTRRIAVTHWLPLPPKPE